MKNKLLILAMLFATSIACFAAVDAFDRHSKSQQAIGDGTSVEADGALHAQTIPTTDMQVARLMAGCTGMAVARADMADGAAAMVCCRDSEAELPNTDHACCSSATAAP